MELTKHERSEWARAAQALYLRGANEQAHLLSACAAVGTVPIQQFDRAAAVYRAWLELEAE